MFNPLNCWYTFTLLILSLIYTSYGDLLVYNSNITSKKNIITILPFENSTLPNVGSCISSSEDFPKFFTEKQKENGAIILAFLIGIYCFTLLAIICDKYFLPCVEKICEVLHLSQDVTAATFMSIATSTPELFVNLIATFITKSDIGIGTVVGSSMFNTLGVASIGGLAASVPLQLHWWPLTRDVIIYILSVILLVAITWDGLIYWYEGLILFIVYFLYFTIMFQNVRIMKFIKKLFKRNNAVADIKSNNINNNNQVTVSVISPYGPYIEEPLSKFVDTKEIKTIENNEKIIEESTSIFVIPKNSLWKKFIYFYTFPLKLLLCFIIPNPKKNGKLFPLTFIMCIFFIGINSYIVSWMIAVIGDTFNIPDTVLGLTFLAAGGGLPEAISITIMSRRGEGSMGVSNSLGANTMDILLSLGMPWFFKTILLGTNDKAYIKIQSDSIEYTIISLILATIVLYVTLYIHKFKLSRKVGFILMISYLLFIILAILFEMVFFNSHHLCKF